MYLAEVYMLWNLAVSLLHSRSSLIPLSDQEVSENSPKNIFEEYHIINVDSPCPMIGYYSAASAIRGRTGGKGSAHVL